MNEALEILKKTGAYLQGHFVGTSGQHINTYINKDALYTHPEQTACICQMMAEQTKDLNVEVVVGPALGGIVLSQWVAYHLGKIRGKEILAVYSEKTSEGGQKFTRGYDKVVQGKKILIVEDAPTTGGSAKKVVDLVQATGGQVVGVSVMVNKNKEVNEKFFGAPLFALAQIEIESYNTESCQMCRQNIPINTEVGHGKKFLESKQ